MSPSYRERVEACVVIGDMAGRILVEVRLDDAMPLGLRIHGGDRDGALRRLFDRSHGQLLVRGRLCSFALTQSALARSFADKLRRDLHQIAIRPLSQKQVERHLGISSAERLRWTKDGRLPKSGIAQIKKGARITLTTYAVAAIEEIGARPELIARWRADDAAR